MSPQCVYIFPDVQMFKCLSYVKCSYFVLLQIIHRGQQSSSFNYLKTLLLCKQIDLISDGKSH